MVILILVKFITGKADASGSNVDLKMYSAMSVGLICAGYKANGPAMS